MLVHFNQVAILFSLRVDVNRTITINFVLGAAMAGIAGVLFALVFRQLNFIMGFIPGIKAFTAAVLVRVIFLMIPELFK